ncbi:hypothetical protein GCM10010460_20770 [Microbacterium terrae]
MPEPDAATPRRSIWPRLRADLRLAARQVRRTTGSSALVMMLVMLPVAGLAGGAIFWQSHIPTREQSATLELGANESRIDVVGGADPSRRQAVDDPWNNTIDTDDQGRPVNPEQPMPEDPYALIPADATVAEVVEWAQVFVETAAGVGNVAATAGDVWDPVFDGRFLLLEGEAPASADQVLVSPGILERLDARVGDEIVLVDSDRTFEITGTMRRADARPADPEVFLPASASDLVVGQTRWYVADWQPGLDELAKLNHAGFVAFAHDLLVHPPAGAYTSQWRNDTAQASSMLMVALIVVAFSGYLIVLLAGAAFAVSARRQQRSLAVAASVGASNTDVFRVVVLQGTVLGTVAGVTGVVLGAAGAWLALELTDSGAVGSFWGNWGYNVPWALTAGILVFAVVVGSISAIAPARAATRGDVIGALRGSRRPPREPAKLPLGGVLVMSVGLGAAIASGLAIAALNSADRIDYAHPLRIAAMFGIVLGPIVFQIGFLIAGRWVLEVVARPVARIGIAPRIAARDAAANPSRVVPAFAAITVCVFIASFALASTALQGNANARSYWYAGPLHSVSAFIYSPTADDDAALVDAADELLAATDPTATVVVSTARGTEYDLETGVALDPDAPVYGVAGQPTETCPDCGGDEAALNGGLTIVAPGDVAALLDMPVSAATLEAYREGAMIITDAQFVTSSGMAVITEWTETSREQYYAAMNTVDWADADALAALPDPDAEHELPAELIEPPFISSNTQAMVSPETAERLGIVTMPSTVVALRDEPLETATLDRITADAAATRVSEGAYIGVNYEDGPDPQEPWLWLITGAAMVLVIAASAVCLGLTRFERRPDDATLTAVGGSRMLRRAINLWQAVIVVGIGSVVGTAAGLIPVWGTTQTSDGYLKFEDAPWLLLCLLAVALPIAIALAAWLVPPRHPDLTRRNAIA